MKSSIKIFFLAIGVSSFSSCNLDLHFGQVNGNGNVTTEDRAVTSDFTEVKGSSGLDIYINEGSENKIVVEADENLQENIETEIQNGRLTISCVKSIGRSKSKKVYVTYVSLNHISSSSGADIIVNSVLKNEHITLDASSGSEIEVEVFAKEITIETSSGADVKVSGKATTLLASSSSGSEIKARELMVVNCNADASSGADITVNTKEKLQTEATSGGTIKYYGNPSAITNDESRSGNVRKM